MKRTTKLHTIKFKDFNGHCNIIKYLYLPKGKQKKRNRNTVHIKNSLFKSFHIRNSLEPNLTSVLIAPPAGRFWEFILVCDVRVRHLVVSEDFFFSGFLAETAILCSLSNAS